MLYKDTLQMVHNPIYTYIAVTLNKVSLKRANPGEKGEGKCRIGERLGLGLLGRNKEEMGLKLGKG